MASSWQQSCGRELSSVRGSLRLVAGRTTLIAYLVAGYPDADHSLDAALAAIDAGADVLELGLPYSDPVMDGTVIQAATQHALAYGFRLAHGF